jgi:hypothetical protein
MVVQGTLKNTCFYSLNCSQRQELQLYVKLMLHLYHVSDWGVCVCVCVCARLGKAVFLYYVFVHVEAILKHLTVESQQSVPLNLGSVTEDLYL